MSEPAFRSTDFFARQDAARTRTRWLVLWFAAGIAGTAAAVYGAAMLCFGVIRAKGGHALPGLWDAKLFLICAGATLLIVGGTSFVKSLSLAGGGGKIAESVGGRRVEPDTLDEDERRLLNIIEEMSLASGVPMPEVYLLDHESAINAFAAGDSVENAAVAVTRGALHKLTRDELQAVMGHEFSHILNGDMRLNLRLIGWISGLLAITVIARVLMDTGQVASFTSRRDDRKNNLALLLFGVLLLIIGYIGNLFAQAIQAAISRQREHLADASATQFTRHPEALASALRRIGGDSTGSRLANPHAGEIAHMCFGEGVASLFATHPPLDERIRLLDATWDGSFLPAATGAEAHFAPPLPDAEVDASFRARFTQGPEVAAAFAPEPRLAPALATMLRTPAGAQAAVVLLLMTDNPDDNRAQAELVKRAAPRELFEALKASWGLVHGVPARGRLDVVRAAAPALRRLAKADADALVALLRALAQSDGEISFFEIALIRTVVCVVAPADDRADESSPEVLAPALRLVLGALLVAGVEAHDREPAFVRVRQLAPGYGDLGTPPSPEELTAASLEAAFEVLAQTAYPLRGQAIAAAEFVIGLDGVVNDVEADLLRALASALRCPVNLA